MKIKTHQIILALLISVASSITKAEAADSKILIDGDVVITEAMFLQEVAILPTLERKRALSDPDSAMKIIENMYRRIKLLREAERQNVAEDKNVKYQIELARTEVLINSLKRKLNASIEVPNVDALAQDHYNANLDDYYQEEMVKARHILLAVTSPEQKEDRRKQAQELLKQLQNGADFAELAREHSDDSQSAVRGGELRWFKKGQMVPPFEKVAFALEKEGQLSDVVETQFGYHIIRLDEKIQARQRTFDEVKESIVRKLTEQYKQNYMRDWFIKITDPSGITINQEAIEALMEK